MLSITPFSSSSVKTFFERFNKTKVKRFNTNVSQTLKGRLNKNQVLIKTLEKP